MTHPQANAPSAPIGPYSPTVRFGDLLVCSGQIGIESTPHGPALVEGGFPPRCAGLLDNVAGCSRVKVWAGGTW